MGTEQRGAIGGGGGVGWAGPGWVGTCFRVYVTYHPGRLSRLALAWPTTSWKPPLPLRPLEALTEPSSALRRRDLFRRSPSLRPTVGSERRRQRCKAHATKRAPFIKVSCGRRLSELGALLLTWFAEDSMVQVHSRFRFGALLWTWFAEDLDSPHAQS